VLCDKKVVTVESAHLIILNSGFVDDVVLLRAGVRVYAPRIHWSAKHVEWLLARASLPYVAIGIGYAFT
jgi:hypothetical protein